MPARIAHLKKRRDFLRIAAARRRWAAQGLVLQAAPAPVEAARSGVIRVGFTASKRVGGAVQRNRAKRRLRAAVARVMPDRALTDCDYVVIARVATLTRPFDALTSDLTTALKRVGALRAREPGDATQKGTGERVGGTAGASG